MAEPLLVLLHSPLTTAAVWGTLPDALLALGIRSVVPEIADDDQPPYAARYVAAAARAVTTEEVAASGADGPLVLVGHSGAGPLLAQVGFALRAAHRAPRAYVFLDAGLPPAWATGPGGAPDRLALMALEDRAFAATLRESLETGARFPQWSPDALADDLADPADRALVAASLRPRGEDFFIEPLPAPTDWPDAPCAYVLTSPAYEKPAGTARSRGWPVVELPLGHFAALADPEGTAAALVHAYASC